MPEIETCPPFSPLMKAKSADDGVARLVETDRQRMVHLVEEQGGIAVGTDRLGDGSARCRGQPQLGNVRRIWTSTRRAVMPGMVDVSVIRRVSDGSSAPSI